MPGATLMVSILTSGGAGIAGGGVCAGGVCAIALAALLIHRAANTRPIFVFTCLLRYQSLLYASTHRRISRQRSATCSCSVPAPPKETRTAQRPSIFRQQVPDLVRKSLRPSNVV